MERQRLFAALERARGDLLAERRPEGHWVGQLSSSALSTATAVSALVIAEQYGSPEQHGRAADRLFGADQIFQSDLSELIVQSLHWLATHQNEDGGWGDTDKSRSNIATTMLVNAAFRLTGVPAKYTGLLERAEEYVRKQGGVSALRKRYGRDKTFAVPILTNCALAGMVSWKEVSPLPFELAVLPQSWYRRLQLPVVSYAIPALVAIGQARHFHARTWNPLTRLLRRLARGPSLKVLERMQPASGGFLEATPLTSFVVMSLASIGLAEHPVVRRGVEFLLSSVRGDGSWPIDSNLATWNTTLAINALCRTGEMGQATGDRGQGAGDGRQGTGDRGQATGDSGQETGDRGQGIADGARNADAAHASALEWLLNCQHTEAHPYTGAAPGGWAWTDLSGGVPDVDDTSGGLLTLARAVDHVEAPLRRRILTAIRQGVRWLLAIQNRDGGWPTFCRGWGYLPFDRSASDLSAHALRALNACKSFFADGTAGKGLAGQIDRAIERGLVYLQEHQQEDGSWLPLWFGNQENPDDENPVYGTSRVLIALAELGYSSSEIARRGGDWLCRVQHASGGWGPVVSPGKVSPRRRRSAPSPTRVEYDPISKGPSTEETSLAVAALARLGIRMPSHEHALEQGLAWLVDAVENGRHTEPAPIGFYFAKLWYYERLYPRIFAVEALQTAAAALSIGERTESYYPASSLQPASS